MTNTTRPADDSWTMAVLTKLRDKDIYSLDDRKIGSVHDIYYDELTRLPEWVEVGVGFLGLKERVIPVETLRDEGEPRLKVPFTKDQIEHEPDFDASDERIREEDEMKLRAYFGVPGHATFNKRLPYGKEFLNDFTLLDAEKPDQLLDI